VKAGMGACRGWKATPLCWLFFLPFFLLLQAQAGRQGREGRKAAYAVPAAALLRCVSAAAGSKRLVLLWSVVACLATLAHAFLRSSVDGGPARSFPIPLPPLLLSSPHSQMVHL
jgi:hypothetical protein